MTVENASAACADTSLLEAVKKAKADLAGVSADDASVTCEASGQDTGSDGRRLTESVVFQYMIRVANATVAENIANNIGGSDLSAVTDKIKEFLPENSSFLDIVVTGVEAKAVVVTITRTSTEAGDLEEDSHARTPAALESLAIAMIAATLFHGA